jgi:hypothetical protein
MVVLGAFQIDRHLNCFKFKDSKGEAQVKTDLEGSRTSRSQETVAEAADRQAGSSCLISPGAASPFHELQFENM